MAGVKFQVATMKKRQGQNQSRNTKCKRTMIWLSERTEMQHKQNQSRSQRTHPILKLHKNILVASVFIQYLEEHENSCPGCNCDDMVSLVLDRLQEKLRPTFSAFSCRRWFKAELRAAYQKKFWEPEPGVFHMMIDLEAWFWSSCETQNCTPI